MIGLLIAYCENCKKWHVFADEKHLFSTDSQQTAYENSLALLKACQSSYSEAMTLAEKLNMTQDRAAWLYTLVCGHLNVRPA